MNVQRKRGVRGAWLVGAVLQGLILGALLSVAAAELWAQADGVRLFRYQAF